MQQRHCLILQGESSWLHEQAVRLHAQQTVSDVLWLSDHPQRSLFAQPCKQALQQLGREFSLLIFDAQQRFAADAFAAALGTLKAGGLLVLMLEDSSTRGRWLTRFLRRARTVPNAIQFVWQTDDWPSIECLSSPTLSSIHATAEQQLAIQAVIKVVTGHRRRPLVISSDRGRGKSALLGMAAAALLQHGKRNIIVTAPGIANVDSLMHHAQLALPDSRHSRGVIEWQQQQIRFVAPDALLEQLPKADLLIVDEAAAIPAALLQCMLSHYSRMVFSTTVHGYEGTGRGFALRFEKYLEQHSVGWNKITLNQPIRWASDDALETFSYDALLLNALPVDDELIQAASVENCDFELVDRDKLADDEQGLRQLFGLMALAHYRTRPSDLQMLLDRDDITVAVLRFQQHIIASVWLVDEPPLDGELATAVFNGERRLKGQLLPQSLLVHAGLKDAGALHYQRIIRIAVHPAMQGKGLGSALLESLQQQLQDHCDVIGTSFAMDSQLIRFWQQNAFHSVRLGQHTDQVSGSLSLMMLKPTTVAGQQFIERALARLQADWPLSLARGLNKLSTELVSLLSTELYPQANIEEVSSDEVVSFALHQRPFEACEIALWHWLQSVLGSPQFNQLPIIQQAVLIRIIMQQWSITEVAREWQLTGRAEVITVLRQSVSALLQYQSSVSR